MDRLSVSSERQEVEEVDEVEGAVPFPAASPEPHVSRDRLIFVNHGNQGNPSWQPMLVPVTCDIATEHPDALLEYPWFEKEEEEKEKKEEEDEEAFCCSGGEAVLSSSSYLSSH